MPLHGITGIASILTVEIAAATLERIVARNGLSEYLLTVAKNLAAVARRWLDLSPEGRADWSDLVYSARAELRHEIGFDPLRMTRRNRHRLAQLSDPRAVRALFSYPWAVMSDLGAERQRRGTVTREMALRSLSLQHSRSGEGHWAVCGGMTTSYCRSGKAPVALSSRHGRSRIGGTWPHPCRPR